MQRQQQIPMQNHIQIEQQQQRQPQQRRRYRRQRQLLPLRRRVRSTSLLSTTLLTSARMQQLVLLLPLLSVFQLFQLVTTKATIIAMPADATSRLAVTSTSAAAAATAATATKLHNHTVAYLHADWEHVNKTCLSRVCNDALNVQHLQQLQRHIRADADACHNFYAYACGNWAHSHPPAPPNTMKAAEETLNERYVQLFERTPHKYPRGQPHFASADGGGSAYRLSKLLKAEEKPSDVAMQAQQMAAQQLLLLAQEAQAESAFLPPHDDNDPVYAKLLQYYRVCANSAPLTLRGYHEQLRTEGLLRPQHRHWQELLAQFARYGYGEQYVHMSVKQQNASHYAITVLPHDAQYHLNLSTELYAQLRDYTHKSQSQLAAEFHALESDLASIVNEMCADASTEADCDLVQTYTYAELTSQCSEIDWQQFLGVPLGRPLHAADLIRVDSLETIRKLARYLNQAQHSALNFLYTLARFLSYLQQQPYSPLRLGVSKDQCIRHLRKTLPIAMSYVYERAYYAPVRAESDRVIRSIFAQLKAEFARTLALNRMQFDADVVAYLQQKLLALRLNLGNLPVNASPAFYVELMRQLNVSQSNFYRNHLHALAHTYAHQRRLATPASGDQRHSVWYTFNYHEPTFPDSLDSTPYYFCLSNIIIIPHAYLQTPFYDRRFWPVLLYGDLANTLGHELLHGFDSIFLEYDHAGNMNELMFQRIEANVHYTRNLACLSEGTAYLGERIADISGTRLALNTFLRDAQFLRTNGRLFFLQFAQFFCGATQGVNQEPPDAWHDSDELRLNYTLAHMPEFASAYNCPAGSAMSPPQRCEMW